MPRRRLPLPVPVPSYLFPQGEPRPSPGVTFSPHLSPAPCTVQVLAPCLLQINELGPTKRWPPHCDLTSLQRCFIATRLLFLRSHLFRTLLSLSDKHFDFTPYCPDLTAEPHTPDLTADLEINIQVYPTQRAIFAK